MSNSDIKKKSSYVEKLLSRSREYIKLDNSSQSKKSRVKKTLKKRKRTLTVSTPFELRTSKRVRLDVVDEEKDH